MLKNISNLGSILNKKELQSIQGSRSQSIQELSIQSPHSGGGCSITNLCPVGQFCICDNDDCSSGTCAYA